MPYVFRCGRLVVLVLDAQAPGTGLLCGHLKLPAHIRRLLLASFPEFMLIRPDQSPVGLQMRSLIEMMTEEATLNDETILYGRFDVILYPE